jgi:acyl-[acyl-carrier-protein]-phospholipid O-acyltransferase/long-chain-fatty-acid--[acyl-carrier-protein] ligase
MSRERSFFPLYLTNLFGTVNDNFLKTLASFTVIGWIEDDRLKPLFMGATAGALVLPYILFSPLADRLATAFAKVRIVRLAKWAELPIMGVAVAGFLLHSAWTVVAAVLLMGLQSAMYSPAKYALVRDIGGEGRISTGMGGMEGISFFGVLAGTIAASVAMDRLGENARLACLAAFAAAGLVASFFLRAEETRGAERRPVNPARFFAESARLVGEYAGLQAVVMTLGVFWWGAAMLQMGLLVFGGEVLGLDATKTGLMLCGAAGGIVAGQVLAGWADKRWGLLWTVPLTGWAAAALLFALCFAPMGPKAFAATLGTLAFDLGFFKLPLDAEIQKVVKGPRLNTVLAYFNQVSFLFMFAASLCYAALSWAFGLRAFLGAMGVAFLVTPGLFALCYRPALLRAGKWLLGRRYDVRVEGRAAVEAAAGPVLVLPNHPAMVDPMLVECEFWRVPLKPLVDERFWRAGPLTRRTLATLGAVAVPDLRAHLTREGVAAAKGMGAAVRKTLAAGGNVIFYPAGHIQREEGADDIGGRRLAYEAMRDLPEGARVVGVRTTGLWGSIWSRAGRKDSPPFVQTLIKSGLLWLVAGFRRKRRVEMRVEDLTDRAREWAKGTRQEFNRALEAWYRGDGA